MNNTSVGKRKKKESLLLDQRVICWWVCILSNSTVSCMVMVRRGDVLDFTTPDTSTFCVFTVTLVCFFSRWCSCAFDCSVFSQNTRQGVGACAIFSFQVVHISFSSIQ
ncbi:hypothetical protein BJY00DRAFT_27495 [Aspergillus carlsbadensis]|nr:hypothetical protein BJY00DRAFT_27495 [Aspergillus carlsbadensis]